ncbi:MAG: NAD-dependent epimerase/dehydratase family protein [Hyphomicrobiales bacterium]
MGKTIAITGATGFAGGHAVAELLKRGHRLVALVRDPARARLTGDVRIVEGDLGNAAALDLLVRGADAVVHVAGAIVAVRGRDYFTVNERGTVAVAAAAARAGVKRFVHVSSLAARQPQLSAYAASKRAAEGVFETGMALLNAIILRPPVVYGPGDRGTLPLIAALTRPIAVIPGRREARFSLMHVEDLARTIADAAESETRGCFELNDGTPGGYSWADLIAAAQRAEGISIRPVFLPRFVPALAAAGAVGISRLTGKPAMVTPGKIAELYHDDWVARGPGLPLADPVGFEAGFARTVEWYRREGWLPPGRGPDRRRTSDTEETKA